MRFYFLYRFIPHIVRFFSAPANLFVFLLFLLCFLINRFSGCKPVLNPQPTLNSAYNMSAIKTTRLHITLKDICRIHDCSDATASRKIRTIRDALGKAKQHVITVQEYCNYFGLDYETTLKHLNLVKC